MSKIDEMVSADTVGNAARAMAIADSRGNSPVATLSAISTSAVTCAPLSAADCKISSLGERFLVGIAGARVSDRRGLGGRCIDAKQPLHEHRVYLLWRERRIDLQHLGAKRRDVSRTARAVHPAVLVNRGRTAGNVGPVLRARAPVIDGEFSRKLVGDVAPVSRAARLKRLRVFDEVIPRLLLPARNELLPLFDDALRAREVAARVGSAHLELKERARRHVAGKAENPEQEVDEALPRSAWPL